MTNEREASGWNARAGRGLFALLALLLLVGAAVANFGVLDFQPLGLDKVFNLLAKIFFIALIFERALEVLITTWRGPEATARELAIEEVEARLKWIQVDAGLTQAERDQRANVILPEHAGAKSSLATYRAGTQRLALWVAFLLGTLLAFAGVRIFGPLLATPPSPGAHRALFVFLDTLLSGAAIAGGSEGIHTVLQSFVSFFEAQGRKAKASAP